MLREGLLGEGCESRSGGKMVQGGPVSQREGLGFGKWKEQLEFTV